MKRKYFYRGIFIFVLTAVFICFFPLKKEKVSANNAAEGLAECVMEQNSRRILYQKNGDKRLPMASTTKIATAITVLENSLNIHEEFAIPPQAEGVEGSSIYLKCGDIYSVEDLLYGLMLRSGNDSATALALHCAESVGAFASLMNITAHKAGALHTHFCNPHGLHDNNHYTTACDLSLITCYAMQNKTFREIVSTEYYAPRQWKNKNKLLSLYEGALGVKTGYTKVAGCCLVSAAERNGMTLICTLLNCSNTYERTAELLNDAFAHYHNEKLLARNTQYEVFDGDKKYKGIVKEDFYYPLLAEEMQLVEIQALPTISPINQQEEGEIIGQIQIRIAKHLLFSTNLYKL